MTFPSPNKLGLRFPFSERERDLSVFQQASNLIQLADIPLVSQSDHGSENYGIVKAQTALHHWHDPSLAGTIQHCWMQQKKNIKPEITWSQLCHRFKFTPGFEDLLEIGAFESHMDLQAPPRLKHLSWSIACV